MWQKSNKDYTKRLQKIPDTKLSGNLILKQFSLRNTMTNQMYDMLNDPNSLLDNYPSI